MYKIYFLPPGSLNKPNQRGEMLTSEILGNLFVHFMFTTTRSNCTITDNYEIFGVYNIGYFIILLLILHY